MGLDCTLQFQANLAGSLLEGWIFDGLHRGDGVDRGNLDVFAGALLNDDVAGQHGADFVFELQGLVGEPGLQAPRIRYLRNSTAILSWSVFSMSRSEMMPKPSVLGRRSSWRQRRRTSL